MAMTSEVRRARFKARSDEYKKKLRDKALCVRSHGVGVFVSGTSICVVYDY